MMDADKLRAALERRTKYGDVGYDQVLLDRQLFRQAASALLRIMEIPEKELKDLDDERFARGMDVGFNACLAQIRKVGDGK